MFYRMAFLLRTLSFSKTADKVRLSLFNSFNFKAPTRHKTDIRIRLKERERRIEDGSAFVKKDTVLFTNDNSKVYNLISYFGAFQVLFWIHTASTSIFLRDTTVTDALGDKDNLPWFAKINLGSKAFRLTFSVLSLTMGGLILFVCLKVPRQAVKSLILREHGRLVTVETFGSFGKPTSFTVPLENVSCQTSRGETKSSLSMKVKGNMLYYLIDNKKGTFHDEKLFDYSVGLKRKL